jgi:hypothetical protein
MFTYVKGNNTISSRSKPTPYNFPTLAAMTKKTLTDTMEMMMSSQHSVSKILSRPVIGRTGRGALDIQRYGPYAKG